MANTYPNFNFMRLLRINMAAAFVLVAMLVSPVGAQQNRGAIDEVTVTGSYIPHTPEDAPVPVEVVDSEELFNLGNPSVVELVKTLGISSGVDGETNQFQSNGLEGTANINLRGLGAGRNLVLLNGRRNVWSPYPIAEQQQLFVDINMIPAVAIDRVEMLKDGAAATYGSDAISGVVNFITRSDFEGMEFALSHKEIDGSQGDQDFGFIWGHDFGNTHVMAALGYNFRNQLKVRDRDWAIHPRGEDANLRGYTSTPNPGAFLDWRAYRSDNPTGMPSQSNIRPAAPYNGKYGLLDPRCKDISGSFATNGGRCTYNYTYFDNLIEEEERVNLFTEIAHELNDDTQLNVEFLYGKNEVPEWWTSPSYPPQLDFDTRLDTGRFIHAYHPGLIALGNAHRTAKFPDRTVGGQTVTGATLQSLGDVNCDVTSDADDCRRLLFYGRPLGASGPTEKRGHREHETFRLAVGLEGELDSGDNYTTSLLWTETQASRLSYDALSERWSEALEGYGICGRLKADGTKRPVSDRADKSSTSGCQFFNPFSNAIKTPQQKFTSKFVNPDYQENLANSKELYEWMSTGVGSEVTSNLLVWDGVIAGEAIGGVGWAVGAQYRMEEYTISPNAYSNLHLNPCATEKENKEFRTAKRVYNPDANNCAGEDGVFGGTNGADDYVGSGPFTFLAGATPFDDDQDIVALFGELNVPFSDDLEVQASIRYEDYGGNVGDTIDPKIALRWQATDAMVVRSSMSSTFRGPTLNQLGGRSTSLSYLNAVGTFKAVDTIGNPDLEPEKANTFNAGVLFNYEDVMRGGDNLRFSIDYWSFDFEDPIIKESFNAITASVFSGAGRTFNSSSAYADRIFCGARLCASGSTPSNISRIKTYIINGPTIETDGFDIMAGYGFEAMNGDWDLTFQLTNINSFDVGASALDPDGLDALGKLNDTVSFLRPIVENKAKFGVKYSAGMHVVNFVTNYTDKYKDAETIVGSPLPARDVSDHTTYDLHYNLSLGGISDTLGGTAAWLSVYNVTDEDPPFARLDLNYDPYTHNPFGRMVKLGIRHSF